MQKLMKSTEAEVMKTMVKWWILLKRGENSGSIMHTTTLITNHNRRQNYRKKYIEKTQWSKKKVNASDLFFFARQLRYFSIFFL